MPVSIALDVLVALLLVVTIAYAIVLNKRLGALRKNKSELEGLTASFSEATKRAEESIKRSERELSGILDSLQDTFYRTDIEGRLLRISPSVEALLGYRPEELLGTKLSDLYVDEDGREKFLKELQGKDGVVSLSSSTSREAWISR